MSTFDNHLQQFEREILEAPRMSYSVQLKLYDIFLPALGCTIIFVNLMVVLSSGLILRKRQQPRSTYIFLGNVSLADMLTGVATIFGQYYPKEGRSETVCCVQIGMIISATLASVYSIGLIAIDRYLYILYGLQYQRYLSSKRARLMILGTWVLGGVIGFMPAMGIRNSTDNGRFCWLIILEPTALILTTVTIGMLPLFVVITLYSIILKRALSKISEMRYSETASQIPSDAKRTQLRYFRGRGKSLKTTKRSANGSDTSRSIGVSYIQEETVTEVAPSHRSFFRCCRKSSTLRISSVYSPSRWKAIKIVAFTTGCFFVTWFPYFLACALYAMCDKDEAPSYCDSLRVAIASPLAILGLVNSLFNPIIYAWWHNGFRESAMKIYNDMWRRCMGSKRNFNGHDREVPSRAFKKREIDSNTKSSQISNVTVDTDDSGTEQTSSGIHGNRNSSLILVVPEQSA